MHHYYILSFYPIAYLRKNREKGYKNKEYIDALKDYQGDLLLAGINYDKKTKKHSCIIERWNL